jgi:predicted RNase H-like HicB family nuclease
MPLEYRTYVGVVHTVKNKYKNEETTYGVSFPDFPSFITTCTDFDKLEQQATEDLQLHVDNMLKEGETLPRIKKHVALHHTEKLLEVSVVIRNQLFITVDYFDIRRNDIVAIQRPRLPNGQTQVYLRNGHKIVLTAEGGANLLEALKLGHATEEDIKE